MMADDLLYEAIQPIVAELVESADVARELAQAYRPTRDAALAMVAAVDELRAAISTARHQTIVVRENFPRTVHETVPETVHADS